MIEQREPSDFTQSSDFFTEVSCFPSDKIGAWLLAIIESIMDGVIVLDATRQLVLFNCEAERIFGYTAKELVGKPLDILLPAPVREQHRLRMDHFAAANEGGSRMMKTRMQLEGVRANGEEFPISAAVSRVMVKGEIFLVVIFRESRTPDNISLKYSLVPTAALRERAVSSQQAGEIEKRRLSRELYDELGQRLSVLKLDMDWLENSLPSAGKLDPIRIAQMQGLLDNIIVRTKNIASSLRPPLLDDFGLLPAIHWLAENFQKKTAAVCEVESSGVSVALGDPVESAIFRLVQEALLNIERHAQADFVKITIWHADRHLEIIIQDDGVGMPADSENKAGCFGLIAMQERIYTLGGTISINNVEPAGVSIHASVPL